MNEQDKDDDEDLMPLIRVLPIIEANRPRRRRAPNRGPDGDACVYKPSFTCYHEDAEE